ncbi:MAG TPA: TIGR03862 family flavoprotein [Ilumatobacteraceae bacterium]|nr:TIGR03862 family flavoprotein [Ilumatobacteraceae bacterium]
MSLPSESSARRTATVIGGGPSGLMAAEVLAESGLQVDLYEHMPSVGRKLLLAGRSGLNLTNSEPIDEMVARFGPASPVCDAVRSFPPTALRAWAAGLGEPTYIGSSGRVFPTSFRATPLLRAWLARLAEHGVRMHLRHRWLGWGIETDGTLDSTMHRFRTVGGEVTEHRSDVTVFALGGASWPRVGSDGSWVPHFRAAGIEVAALRPANCGLHIEWSRVFVEQLAGVPLKNVRVSAGSSTARGDVMVTDRGLESGPIYMISAEVRDIVDRDGTCTVTIDLHPDLTRDAVIARLSSRRPKDSMTTFLRRSLGLSPAAIALLREATDNELPSAPITLAPLVKAVTLAVQSVAPIERAISTAGGVSFDDLDGRFMIRRLPGTFIAGEMLDWEAPTGGYLLQASFSTAVAAANGAIAWLAEP